MRKPTLIAVVPHISTRPSRLFFTAAQTVASMPDATDWYDTSRGHPKDLSAPMTNRKVENMGGRRQYSGPASNSTSEGTTRQNASRKRPSFTKPHMLHFQRLPPSVKLMKGLT